MISLQTKSLAPLEEDNRQSLRLALYENDLSDFPHSIDQSFSFFERFNPFVQNAALCRLYNQLLIQGHKYLLKDSY